MEVTTTLKEIADFWAERDFVPKVLYELDGVTYWRVTVDDGHPMFEHPEYVALAFKEKLEWHHTVKRRLQPKLYGVKKNGLFADVQDPGGKRAVPLSRRRNILRAALTHPGTNESPEIVVLKNPHKIRQMLLKAHRAGVDRILFFAAEGFTESFSIEEALNAVQA